MAHLGRVCGKSAWTSLFLDIGGSAVEKADTCPTNGQLNVITSSNESFEFQNFIGNGGLPKLNNSVE
jgi:hypothetical protein